MKEVNPQLTSRAEAFNLWMDAPQPMVTLLKRLDVTVLVKYAKMAELKFNMLMCYCIGKAASGIPEFKLLPVDRRLMEYDNLAINVVVMTKNGSIKTCDVPYNEDLFKFNAKYLLLTQMVADLGTNYDIPNAMVIGTSALVQYDLEGAIGMYSGIYNNPYMIWSRYRRHWFRKEMVISFQFHHVQMDGVQASFFLQELQNVINHIDVYSK